VARIEPVPFEEIPAESRAVIEEGLEKGMYTNALPLQIVAYSSVALRAMHAQYEVTFRQGVLEPRLVELLRLNSARINECMPCSQSRKDLSITEDDVSCMVDLDPDSFSKREYRALRFSEMFAGDYHSIDDETFRWLSEVFTPAEIIELGYVCSQNLAGHRFMHILGVLDGGEPVVHYRPGSVDESSMVS